MTAKLMFPKWKLQEGEEDFTIMRVTIEGEDSGGKVKHIYTLHDFYDRKNKITSMARTTAYTCTAAVHLLASGKYSRKGISPPEFVGAEKDCFEMVLNYLKERNVFYNVKTTQG
jgi:saccharopine dehydrogenase-like NADP-dependent oxidoreductase